MLLLTSTYRLYQQERVQLTRYVTETNIIPIVANTCDRLVRNHLFVTILSIEQLCKIPF